LSIVIFSQTCYNVLKFRNNRMKNKRFLKMPHTKKIISSLFLLAISLAPFSAARAAAISDYLPENISTTEEAETPNIDKETLDKAQTEITQAEYQEGNVDDLVEKLKEKKAAELLLGSVEARVNEIAEKKLALNKEIAEHKVKVDSAKSRVNTLENQLSNIADKLEETTNKIASVQENIANKKEKIAELEGQITAKEEELNRQVETMRQYIRLIDANSSHSTLELLLASDTLSDALRETRDLEILENQGRRMLDKLKEIKQELEYQRKKLLTEKVELEILEENLQDEQKNIEQIQEARKNLLDITKGEEKEYQKLLDKAVTEYKQLDSDVNSLQGTILDIQDGSLEQEAVDRIEGARKFASMSLTEDEKLSWPISPARGITAYFHDSEYATYWGVAHNATDIRAYQGSPIYAANDAYVYKAGTTDGDYSYIILAHAGNIFTVYGHISEFAVKTGDIIARGDLIGLSGGMPGTKGAGVMTTGPHLHFEVHEGSEARNPFDFLPLREVPLSYLPDEYLDDLVLEIKNMGKQGLTDFTELNGELTQK